MASTEKDLQHIESNDECDSNGSDESSIDDSEADSNQMDEDDDEDEGDSENGTRIVYRNKFFGEQNFDYLSEAVKLLENRAEVNSENAIALNRSLQDMLETLRHKMISMLNTCRHKYIENQHKLSNSTNLIKPLKGISSCASPFFKDALGKHCPPNDDYKYRSEVEKELFPSDLELFPHLIWTPADKLSILQGVKEQAIEYIERKQSYPSTSSDKKQMQIRKNVKLHSLKLKELLGNVDSEFTIDWNQISVYNLDSRHTGTSCFAIWNVYLKPELNRDEWSDDENLKLNALAKKYKFQDWIAIAEEMTGRSDYQCFVQYQTVVSVRMREDKGERWTKDEDELLLSLVEKNRVGNLIRWNPICSQLPNRTKKQCFARYKYGINPSILRAPFTQEEDCIILAAVQEYGENFNLFPKALFPNRTVVQIRNRYNNSIKAREHMRAWTPDDDKMLLNLVVQHGNSDWKKISESFKTHSRTSCRTRFLVISRFLKENPNASIIDLPRKNRTPLSSVTKRNWMNKFVEIKAPTEKKDVKKNTFRSRLRRKELEWYDFLKFGYDFKLLGGYKKVSDHLHSLEFARIAFDLQQQPTVTHDHRTPAVVRVYFQKLQRLHWEKNKFRLSDAPDIGYRLPPSYCTMLGFRGLCILSSSDDDDNKGADISSPIVMKELPEVQTAKEKFRQRLESLLYKTTLLSRLDPDLVVIHDHYEVIIHQSSKMVKLAKAKAKVVQINEIAKNLRIATYNAKRISSSPPPPPPSKKQKIEPK